MAVLLQQRRNPKNEYRPMDRQKHKRRLLQSDSKRQWAIRLAIKNVLQITYHVWIDDFVYGSSRESFHKSVKCSVNNDSQNKCDKSKGSVNYGKR